MPTYKDIVEQIRELKHTYFFFTQKEVKRLPSILLDNEEVRAVTSGFNEGKTVLCVCTNRRVLFLDSGMFFGQRQRQMALDRVQSVNGEYVILFGSLSLSDGSSFMTVNMVLASTIDPFVKSVRAAIDEFRNLSFRETLAGSQAMGQNDLASQLERLAKLLESGHLTREEFEAQKKRLLG